MKATLGAEGGEATSDASTLRRVVVASSLGTLPAAYPNHPGDGWFGGFLPLIAAAVTTSPWARETFGAGAISRTSKLAARTKACCSGDARR